MEDTVTAGQDKRWMAVPLPIHAWVWEVKTGLEEIRGRRVTLGEALEHIRQVYDLAVEA